MAGCPESPDAECRGVAPDWLRALTMAPASRSEFTMARFC